MAKTHPPYASGVSASDDRAGPFGSLGRGSGPRVRVLCSDDSQLGAAGRTRRGASRRWSDEFGARGASAASSGESYAFGEYRLRESAGLSERARSGLGTVVVPAGQGSTSADVGDEAEGGVARGGDAPAAVERSGETAHRGGELPQRGIGLGGGAAPRCSHQCAVPVAADTGTGFVPVVVEAPEPSSEAECGRMEIVLGDDVRVVVDATVHAGALARVLAVVGRR